MDESFDDDFSASLPSTLSKVVQTTVLCPAFAINLFGNICVCLAVARVRSLKQRPNTPFLASLALTDLSFSSFLLFRLIWLYDFEAASKVCEFFAMVICTHSLVTVIHICLLSYDRYVAIVNPLRYRSIMTTKHVKRVLTAAWFALLVGKIILPFSYRSNSSTHFRRSMIGCLDFAAENKPSLIHITNIAFNITFLMALPLAVTVFVYIRIAKISWTLSNQLEPGEYLNPEKAELRRKRRKEMKWMKTIVLVIGAFVLCHFTQLIYVVLSTKLGTSQIPEELRTSMILLTAIHSILNPIIYVFRSNEFKRAFKMFFTTSAALAQFANTNNATARSCMSPLELSARDPRNNRLPSFLVPSLAENVTVIAQDKQDPMVSFLHLQEAEHQEQLVQDSKTVSHKYQVVSTCDQSRGMHTDVTTRRETESEKLD